MWIPAEVAEVVSGQPFRNKLPDDTTSSMINFACNTPVDNATSIEKIGLPQLGIAGDNQDLVCTYITVGIECC